MASAGLFEMYPPFPESILPAHISKFALSKLKSGDRNEARGMFDACCRSGVFLLDLQGDPGGEELQQDIEAVFSITKQVMELSMEEKLKYKHTPPTDYSGYKRAGCIKPETGKPDRCEFYTIKQDDILNTIPHRPNPKPVEKNRKTLSSFIRHALPIIAIISGILDEHLKLSPGTLLALQPQIEASTTVVRLVRYLLPPTQDRGTALMGHADLGTITLLCIILGGLQVLPPGATPEDAKWQFVRPEQNCIVVIIGDTLVKWAGGTLRSCVHRVVSAPGEQMFHDRLGIAYLVRAEKGASTESLVRASSPLAEEHGNGRTVDHLGGEAIESAVLGSATGFARKNSD